jgi:ABC-type Fe3+-hydroxamate transport system substrate-binding protein
MIADRVLSELCEPGRIVAFTTHGLESREAQRYREKAVLSSRAPLEQVLALKPDLLIVNNLVDPGYVGRLRERGIQVFDLGHMRGLETLLPNIRAIGLLVGAPERGEAYARALERRMNAVTSSTQEAHAPRALYLSIYADRLYGGALRTSYHDVLTHAGLRDLAGEAGLDGWPELTPERVLSLSPEVLVTKVGMGAVLCRHAGLQVLGPCQGKGRIIELDGALLDDPGPGMLDATEALHDAYWGAP